LLYVEVWLCIAKYQIWLHRMSMRLDQ
jgi:hypothetical protein